MKIHRRTLSRLACLGMALGLLAGAAHADTLADIKARKKILVGIDLGVPPYGMLDKDLKPSGSDVETAQLLARDLGVALEIVTVTGASRVPSLLTGKSDIVVSSFSVNEERKKVIDFSLPYGELQNIVAAPAAMNIRGYADLAGKRIVVTRGTTADQALTANVKDAQIVRYDDDATLITAVVSGQADIAGTTPTMVPSINGKQPGKPLEVKFVMKTFPYAIGVRKGDDALRGWLDTWVQANLKNGKLGEIYKKYQGVPLPASMS